MLSVAALIKEELVPELQAVEKPVMESRVRPRRKGEKGIAEYGEERVAVAKRAMQVRKVEES